MPRSKNKTIKPHIILVGEENTGKSCLLARATGAIPAEQHTQTIDIDFKTARNKIINEKTKADFQIWDTAGAEKYEKMPLEYYEKADIFCICVDLMKETETIKEEIAKYHQRIQNLRVETKYKITLVGCKADQLDQQKLSEKQAFLKQQAEEIGATSSVCTQTFGDDTAVQESTNAFFNALAQAIQNEAETIQQNNNNEEVKQQRSAPITTNQTLDTDSSNNNLAQLKKFLTENTYSLLRTGKKITINPNNDQPQKTKYIPTHVQGMLKAESVKEIQHVAWVALHTFSPSRLPHVKKIYRDIVNKTNNIPGITQPFPKTQTFNLSSYPDKSDDALTQWKHKILNKMRMRIGGTKVKLEENGTTKTIRIPAHMLGILMSENKEEAQRFAELALQAKAPGRTQAHRDFYSEVAQARPPSSAPGVTPQ